jgi:hypothetical protein
MESWGNDVEFLEFEAECDDLPTEGGEIVLVGFANLLD